MKFFGCFVALCVFCCSNVLSQNKMDILPSKITEQDFELPKNPLIDDKKGAVILSDRGSISFVGNKNNNWISYVFVKKTRIKIVDKTSFKLASVRIYLYGRDERKDKLENISGSTYNMEDGKLVETKLKPEDIFEDQRGNNLTEKKFTMPGVKEGSVIEYSYSIRSYRYGYLPSWNFQHLNYPCLYSSIEIGIPDLLRYTILHKGIDSVPGFTTEESRERLQLASVTVTTAIHHHKWEMKNIEAFSENTFLYDPDNYVDRIEFYLAQTYNGQDVSSMTTWTSANAELLSAGGYGAAADQERSANLYNTMDKLTGGASNLEDAAKSIYAYVRNNFTCINDDDINVNYDLYEVNKRKKGNVAEINLLLTALLRQKGLKADPVILSTRDYGTHPVNYPTLDKMNYTICMLRLYGDTVYLDASKPQLGFGKLSLDCFNGHGRIISEKDTGDIFLFPESVHELSRTTIFIQNDEKSEGTMSGSIQFFPGYHDSYNIRKAINKEGIETYFKKVKGLYGNDVLVSNAGIDSLDRLETPLAVHYDIGFKPGNGEDLLYYNPVIGSEYKSNPFSAAERKCPVEMPAPVDDLYVINMEIPKGYVINEMPKSAKVMFNGNEGFYEYIIQKDETGIQLRTRIKLNRAVYMADEYNSLRDFFAFVVKKQTEQIVFKKKK